MELDILILGASGSGKTTLLENISILAEIKTTNGLTTYRIDGLARKVNLLVTSYLPINRDIKFAYQTADLIIILFNDIPTLDYTTYYLHALRKLNKTDPIILVHNKYDNTELKVKPKWPFISVETMDVKNQYQVKTFLNKFIL